MLILLVLTGCSQDTNDDDSKNTGNNLSLGMSANDLLSEEKFTSMQVEVLYTPNAEPAAATLQEVKKFLKEHTFKPNGISISPRMIDPIDKDIFTISEVKKIETDYRSSFNAGDEISVLILFVDGKSENQKNNKLILGTAYKNTSMVIFSQTTSHLAETTGISKDEIEATTIKHEFGHLFGLVDNGSPAQSQHEDGESKSHCNVEGCLMVAAIEFGSGAVKMMQKQAVTGFDASCRKDLQANGGR